MAAVFCTVVPSRFSALSLNHQLDRVVRRRAKIGCHDSSADSPPPRRAPSYKSKRRGNYDVFLSFRGEDLRNNFLSHLYNGLDQRGINTFIDNEALRKGDEISPTLMKAIEESHIAVVLFSENYAASGWCLSELAKIMECKVLRDLEVKPVFYKVEPREVRHWRGIYGVAMARQEKKYGKYSKKVKSWKKALSKAADLSGWHFVDGDNQADLVKDILKDILGALNRVPLEVAKHPIGISDRVKAIWPLLRIDPPDDHGVHMLGIHGLGGAGKTTIAKAIFNEISHKFDGCCFLSNVRETFGRTNGPVLLQQKLLSELLLHKDFAVPNVDAGIVLIRDRLCYKKVLIVLDDVDHLDQLNTLAGISGWFVHGSRIIITTRDEHLLTSHGVKDVYRVELLDGGDALELFCRHAFPTSQERTKIDRVLINRILTYVNGLPLGLVVLGTFLCGRSALHWEGTLEKLEQSPERTINTVLKISFDGLDDNEKEIFLDIACFFEGCDRDYVTKVLNSCRLNTLIGLQILVERCLVTIDGGKIQMHDLLQVMGKDIVYQECPDNARNRSRIWRCEDALDLLSEDTVTYAVKGMVLDNLQNEETRFINTDTLISLRRLRLLIVRGSLLLKGPVCLPSSLRWIEWHEYSASSVNFDSPRKLVGLDLRNSNLKSLGRKGFYELKYLNLRRCESLEALSDISTCRNLESLDLNGCTSLVEVHESVGFLEKLVHLDLGNCPNLTKVPSTLKSRNFRTLNFANCSRLCVLPEIQEVQHFLTEFHLEGTSVKELPISVGNLIAVEVLNLNCCEELAVVPSSIYRMQALKLLTACNCTSLVEFPDKEEEILHSGLDEQPQEVSNHQMNLIDVDFKGCIKLKRLPNLSDFLFQSVEMYRADFTYCDSLVSSDMDLVLPYEKVRRFVGYADILLPWKELPHWMNFQSTKCRLTNQVLLPEDLEEDDVLGLALAVAFETGCAGTVEVIVGGKWFLCRNLSEYKMQSVHTWFLYIPRPFLRHVANMGRDMKVVFCGRITTHERIGMHVVCRHKEDETRIAFWNCLTEELPSHYE